MSETTLKNLIDPALNEAIKNNSFVHLKLIKTVHEFTEELSTIYQDLSQALQTLVENFRIKNADLRDERSSYSSSLFASWEIFLQEVEVDSQASSDIAATLLKEGAIQLLSRFFPWKIKMKKAFSSREQFESIIKKTEDMLTKCYRNYQQCYEEMKKDKTETTISEFFVAHNAYVQQLCSMNGMIEYYNNDCLPAILDDLQQQHAELSLIAADCIKSGSDMVCTKTANSLQLKNEIVTEGFPVMSIKNRVENFRKEANELEFSIKSKTEALEVFEKLQQKTFGCNSFAKVDEIQEEISSIKFDLQLEQLHLCAVRAQRDLFLKSSTAGIENPAKERKYSPMEGKRTRSKWLSALRSLKGSTLDANSLKDGSDRKATMKNSFHPRFANVVTMVMAVRKIGREKLLEPTPALLDSNFHMFQEYTYRKLTACDVCQQILRGHTKQGLKCRLCKQNVHVNCKEKAKTCNPKSKLLRRQKSTSDIDSRIVYDSDDQRKEKVDGVYQVLKQANELGGSRKQQDAKLTSSMKEKRPEVVISNIGTSLVYAGKLFSPNAQRVPNPTSLEVKYTPNLSSSVPPSPRRRYLNLRVKSFSLDSPESNELGCRRNQTAANSYLSSFQSPCSPVQVRHLPFAKNSRMSSLEFSDETEKSYSSEASVSPSPSSCIKMKSAHRLLPSCIYVVLHDYKSENDDELELRIGNKVTVIDTIYPDWWKGKCAGRIGYFPSRYVTKLQPNEKVVQVSRNLQLEDAEGITKLRKDEVGEEIDGVALLRNGLNQQYACPAKYVVEI